MGSVGALLAFTSREDVDFFSHLEMHLRQEHPPLCGRDHMAYRSAYFPVKDVIDGDLCEQYPSLPADMQRKIADELDRTPGEILKKLEDIRNKII
uniref:RSE1/DDB1/CPSF1 C-terminal domain-containing protein n=2 Tax=PACMAD clade TaxID=147370 RepID=A0A0A9JZE2_ARUDO